MKEVSLEQLDISRETNAENQRLEVSKKLKEIFHDLDLLNPPTTCPIRDIFSVVSDKWSVLIFIFLGSTDKLRFNDLKRCLYGISSKVLSVRLKQLESDGYVNRIVTKQVPIKVEYELTEFGRSFTSEFLGIFEWVQNNKPEILANRKK